MTKSELGFDRTAIVAMAHRESIRPNLTSLSGPLVLAYALQRGGEQAYETPHQLIATSIKLATVVETVDAKFAVFETQHATGWPGMVRRVTSKTNSRFPKKEEQVLLYSRKLSKCCGARSAIVRSRKGGFVSQDCTECGASIHIRPEHFPAVPCWTCRKPLVVKKKQWSNYYFVCESCNGNWKVADVVPGWHEYFDYHGLAAYREDLTMS
jgi:hypothetical protein